MEVMHEKGKGGGTQEQTNIQIARERAGEQAGKSPETRDRRNERGNAVSGMSEVMTAAFPQPTPTRRRGRSGPKPYYTAYLGRLVCTCVPRARERNKNKRKK